VRVGEGKFIGAPERVGAVNAIGPLAGIWVTLQRNNGFGIVIREVLPNGPAAKAGLQAGQILTEVDGTRLEDLTESKAQSLILGPAGTAVRLEVMDPKNSNKTTVVHLIRKPLQLPNVAVPRRDPQVAAKEAFNRMQWEWKARINPTLEPVAQFSLADKGADKAIREALTNAGIAFSITEGDAPVVQAPAYDALTAKELLEKLRVQGHWSVTPLSEKDAKAPATAP
jgi:hypothetical protein